MFTPGLGTSSLGTKSCCQAVLTHIITLNQLLSASWLLSICWKYRFLKKKSPQKSSVRTFMIEKLRLWATFKRLSSWKISPPQSKLVYPCFVLFGQFTLFAGPVITTTAWSSSEEQKPTHANVMHSLEFITSNKLFLVLFSSEEDILCSVTLSCVYILTPIPTTGFFFCCEMYIESCDITWTLAIFLLDSDLTFCNICVLIIQELIMAGLQ